MSASPQIPPARTLLIVEDDPEIRRLVADMLAREGYEVIQAADGAEMEARLARHRPDLVILDIMLPGEDGLSICRRLRAAGPVPILMLTARGDEIDRVIGLEMGADDYLPKPFGPRELLARVRALLRRAGTAAAAPAARRLGFAGLVADLDARRLSRDGADVALTSTEFDLLTCFLTRPRRVLSRDQLLDSLHGRRADPFDRSIDMAVSRLRRKLDAVLPGETLISTVRNNGYLFTADVRRIG